MDQEKNLGARVQLVSLLKLKPKLMKFQLGSVRQMITETAVMMPLVEFSLVFPEIVSHAKGLTQRKVLSFIFND